MLHEIILAELDRAGFSVKSYTLRENNIAACMGCFDCWVKTPGVCVINDVASEIAKDVVQSEVLVKLTPIVFGGYSSDLKKALDRSIPILLPFFREINGEIHHRARYKHYPKLLVVGYLQRPNPEYERLFRFLVQRNAINMHNDQTHSEIFYEEQVDEAAIRQELAASVSELRNAS